MSERTSTPENGPRAHRERTTSEGSSTSPLPKAEPGVWHKVLGDTTRALVEGDRITTLCGCTVYPELVPHVGAGSRTSMPNCPRCEAMLEAWAETLAGKADEPVAVTS